MMRHSKIHANSVFSLVIYLEQRVPLSYEVFYKDCLPAKSQSATVCASDSFTFRHQLFHMETYSKTTAWKRRLLRDAHKETGPFIQTLTSSSVVWSANNAHFSVKFKNTLKQFFCATQATFPSWLQFLGLSARRFETTNIHSHTSKRVRCHEASTTKLNKNLNNLK